jgi:hypothetical protein
VRERQKTEHMVSYERSAMNGAGRGDEMQHVCEAQNGGRMVRGISRLFLGAFAAAARFASLKDDRAAREVAKKCDWIAWLRMSGGAARSRSKGQQRRHEKKAGKTRAHAQQPHINLLAEGPVGVDGTRFAHHRVAHAKGVSGDWVGLF